MIFLVLMGDHLYRLTHMLRASKVDVMTIVATPIFFRWSISGSADQLRNWTTSLAIWEAEAGVPSSYSTRPS